MKPYFLFTQKHPFIISQGLIYGKEQFLGEVTFNSTNLLKSDVDGDDELFFWYV